MPVDLDAFPTDPRQLSLDQRRACRDQMQAAQRNWLGRLRALSETAPADDFPAFLLGTPPFRPLAQRLSGFPTRRELPTGLADELDRFVHAFRDYLRTCSGEDAFPGSGRRAG